MAKLSDGRTIVVDLARITIAEWRLMWKFDSDEDKSDEIFGRCVGMTMKEIQSLSFRDYQTVARAIREEAAAPFSDSKNSASASTSD